MRVDHEADKPRILRAIELILAKPEAIHAEAQNLLSKFRKVHSGKSEKEVLALTANKIISNYSHSAAFVGGITSLTSVIPGIGTALAMFGGATTDAALCMKYQIEMTMAIASVYGHNILLEEEKRICLIVAGLGAVNEATKEGGKAVTSRAFIKLAQLHLKGATLQTVKLIFRQVGITFTRKALEKAIPFGIGAVIGFFVNKAFTRHVGRKACDFFSYSD